jgi:hypothetical protein
MISDDPNGSAESSEWSEALPRHGNISISNHYHCGVRMRRDGIFTILLRYASEMPYFT